MNPLLRFLLLLRLLSNESVEGNRRSSMGAITTRSLSFSFSPDPVPEPAALRPGHRYFLRFLIFLTPAGTAANRDTVCSCCPNFGETPQACCEGCDPVTAHALYCLSCNRLAARLNEASLRHELRVPRANFNWNGEELLNHRDRIVRRRTWSNYV